MYLVALIGSVMLICLVPSLNTRLAEILIMLGKVPKVSGRGAIFNERKLVLGLAPVSQSVSK